MNYLLQSEVIYRTVDLQGAVTNVVRENRNYFMPLIGYGIGKKYENGFNRDVRLSGGMKYAADFLNSGLLFLDF